MYHIPVPAGPNTPPTIAVADEDTADRWALGLLRVVAGPAQRFVDGDTFEVEEIEELSDRIFPVMAPTENGKTYFTLRADAALTLAVDLASMTTTHLARIDDALQKIVKKDPCPT